MSKTKDKSKDNYPYTYLVCKKKVRCLSYLNIPSVSIAFSDRCFTHASTMRGTDLPCLCSYFIVASNGMPKIAEKEVTYYLLKEHVNKMYQGNSYRQE